MPDRTPKGKKAKSERGLHEPIILLLIAGVNYSEIGRMHNMARQSVEKIYYDNKERIDSERAEILADLQRKLNKTFEDHNVHLAKLLEASTENVARSIEAMTAVFDAQEQSGKPFKPLEIAKLGESSARIFDCVKTAVLKQQKDATS